MGQKLNPKADEEETNRSLPAVISPANITGDPLSLDVNDRTMHPDLEAISSSLPAVNSPANLTGASQENLNQSRHLSLKGIGIRSTIQTKC